MEWLAASGAQRPSSRDCKKLRDYDYTRNDKQEPLGKKPCIDESFALKLGQCAACTYGVES